MKKIPGDEYYKSIMRETGYLLNKPDERHFMGLELDEISGIAWLGKDRFAAVHDEEGRIFIYDWGKKKVIDRIKFHKDGDFEDIEVVGSDYFILESNGHVYRKSITGNQEAEVYGNPIKSKNDAEGLTWLPGKERLLIALKGEGEVDDNNAKGKGFYLFDPEDDKMKDDPLFTIKKKDMEKSIPDSLSNYSSVKNIKFAPSGIAVHPFTKELYIISANEPWLVIMDKVYEIKNAIPLDPKVFRQAEGICFSENGDLYISNEAAGRSANILKFKYRK